MKLFCMNECRGEKKEKDLPKSKQRMVANTLKLPKHALKMFGSKEIVGTSLLEELSFAPDRDSLLKSMSQKSNCVNFLEFVDGLKELMDSLVRSKTGSEYVQDSNIHINSQGWSKKLYQMELGQGIPFNLHFDEELLTSVIVNLFSYCLQTMKKSFVYIVISYCHKTQTLKVVIDEKGVSILKKQAEVAQAAQYVETNSIEAGQSFDYENLDF
jgi:hypothetical protein